jgi:hypothetical protein
VPLHLQPTAARSPSWRPSILINHLRQPLCHPMGKHTRQEGTGTRVSKTCSKSLSQEGSDPVQLPQNNHHIGASHSRRRGSDPFWDKL